MPGIKKKWIKASHKDENERIQGPEREEIGDDDREVNNEPIDTSAVTPPQAKPIKRAAQSPKGGMLKGLDGEVLLEKRKRFVPTAELKLSEWLESNVEKKPDVTLSLTQLYGCYTELCQGQSWDVLDSPEFNKVIKTKYGKAFGLTETSVLKGFLKERKLNQEKKKPLHGLRMKDVVHEALQHYGNPTQGVRFFSLKQFIGTKYPALQVDLKPKILKRALEMGVKFGYFSLVKGIGMAGFYRITGVDALKEETDAKKEEKESKKETKEGEETTAAKDNEEKSQEESADDKENKEDVAEEKKKETKAKKPKPVQYSSMNMASPDKIEDTFPLAITYQSAPKVVGLHKIRKYIAGKYNEEVTDNRWRQVIEKGVQNGSWEHVSGSGISGSLHLLMDDFDPSSSQIEDQVCAAIIACHEPKSASANQMKKYVSQYHPEFKVDERPDRFKKALIRAVNKNMIVQVSGLGANGSFQLTLPFIPSPAILAGDEESSAEEGSDDDNEPVYVSKGTKSRGVPKAKPSAAAISNVKGKGNKSQSGRGRPRKRPSYTEDSSDEESYTVPAKKKKGQAGKKSPAGRKSASSSKSKGKKRELSPLTDEQDSEEEEVLEYTPRKSKSRGGSESRARSAGGRDQSQIKSKGVKAGQKKISTLKMESPKKAKKGSKSTKKKMRDENSDADDEEDFALEYTPRKSKSRGGEDSRDGPTSKKQAAGRGRKAKK